MRLLPLALLLCIAQLAAAQTAPANKPPFTLSKETTVITSPLLPDGTPDYLAALNEKFGKDVTPANNGLALYAQLVDPQNDLVLESDNAYVQMAIPRILKLAGVDAGAEHAPHFETIFEWVQGKNSSNAARDELELTRTQLWVAADHPLIHDYLESQSHVLDLIEQAAKQPRWWFPAVAKNGQFGHDLVFFNNSVARQAANSLAARAAFRSRAGDFDGFLRDALAVKQLAHHLAGSGARISALAGATIDNTADDVLSAVVGSGTLSQPQCKTLATALATFDPIADITAGYQTEFWENLRFIQLLATHRKDFLESIPMISDFNAAAYYGAIDSAAVDWDVVLTRANENFTQMLAAMKQPTMKNAKDAAASLDQNYDRYVAQNGLMPDLHRHAGESPAAYSQRISNYFSNLPPRPSIYISMMDSARRAHLEDQMVDCLLAAATRKAQTGAWPKTLDLPQDIYPVANPAPIKFTLSPRGLELYSVGANGIDDHATNDDLHLGPASANPPASANLP